MSFFKASYIFLCLLFCCITFYASAQLKANFTASATSGCAPLIVQFTDQSTGNPTAWNWDFGNQKFNTVTTPATQSTTYPNPGIYVVTLAVSNGSTASTSTVVITVYNKPVADFKINPNPSCVGQPVLFSDSSKISQGGKPIRQWAWDFGDGSFQNTTNGLARNEYTLSGTFPVSLIISDENGCSSSKIKNITITPFPKPSFTTSTSFKCNPPLQVNFTNTSGNSPQATIKWLFGDTKSASTSNASNTYTTFGEFDVSLIISQNGCTDTLTIDDKVIIRTIKADFTTSSASVCAGKSLSFNNTSFPPAATSKWTFGDGKSNNSNNTTNSFATAGNYPVTLMATDANGCKDTITKTISVGKVPVVNFTTIKNQACSVPFPVIFINSTIDGNAFTWDFGDGTRSSNSSHTYTIPGIYPVKLTAIGPTGSCSDSLTKTDYIKIIEPIAEFDALPDSGCVPLKVTLKSSSTSPLDPIASYQWDFGNNTQQNNSNANTTVTYNNVGVFTQQLIITTQTGCRDTVKCSNCIKTGIKPISSFSLTDSVICYGQNILLNESASNETGYKWLPGDGGNSLLGKAKYMYQDTGLFKAKLIAFHNGCPDTSSSKSIRVKGPKASFTKTMSCTNYYDVLLNSTSVIADSVYWNFGDGAQEINNLKDVNHLYATRGNKTITLQAYNFTTGCIDTITGNLVVAQPIARIKVDTTRGCFPFKIKLDGTLSQDPNKYDWDFGVTGINTDISSLAQPEYTYTVPGGKNVKLIITDVNGCKDSTTKNIQPLGPLVDFKSNVIKGCSPLKVNFTDITINNAVITNRKWTFGEGDTINSSINTINHQYNGPGNYAVSLTVTDADGCVKTKSVPAFITITQPYPEFSVDTFSCANEVFSINALSSSSTGQSKYIWNFGNGSLDSTSGATLNYAYTANNIYKLSLTIKDENGCDSTLSKNIYIIKPEANFSTKTLNSGCGNMQVAFTDASTGYVNKRSWSFGNGASSSQPNPAYTYTEAGYYPVTLIVTNLGGCKDTLVKDSIIRVEGPIGSFSFAPLTGCPPLRVTFKATSTNTDNFYWDLGNGTVIDGGDSISYTYKQNGNFKPVLILSDSISNGTSCLLPAEGTGGQIEVIKTIEVNIPQETILLWQDSTAIINAGFSGGIAPFTSYWFPKNNAISCDSCSETKFIGTGTSYMFYYMVSDSSGCMGIDSIFVESKNCANPENMPNIFSPNGDEKNDLYTIPSICSGESVEMKIFNRWGVQMFSTTSIRDGWDGRTTSGIEAENGTYYYLLKIGHKNYKGFFQLFR